jgi:centrosome and spindle pole-associated protein 1
MVFGEDEGRDQRLKSVSKASGYAEELKRQMAEKKEREQQEKNRRLQEDIKLEQAAMEYNPFGKGGAGAPIRDAQGNIVTNTKHQAKLNAVRCCSACTKS